VQKLVEHMQGTIRLKALGGLHLLSTQSAKVLICNQRARAILQACYRLSRSVNLKYRHYSDDANTR